MRRRIDSTNPVWVAMCGAVVLFGCGEAKLPTLEQAKQAVGESVDGVREQAGTAAAAVLPTGNIELTLDAPIRTAEAYARVARFSAGRPGVLQITSYEDPAREQYPSVLLRAELPAGAAAALAGQTLQAQAFVQPTNGGPIWQTTSPIEIRLTAADDATLTGEIVRGEIVNVDTDVKVQLSGKFTAVLP